MNYSIYILCGFYLCLRDVFMLTPIPKAQSVLTQEDLVMRGSREEVQRS